MTITDQALAKLQPAPGAPASAWAMRISACWQASVKAILEVGRLLAEAKAALPGEFGAMIATDLPFTARTAQMLMAISADPRLTNAKHVSHLPASWGTMYELTKLDDATFEAKIEAGVIKPDMERADVVAIRKEAAKAPERRAYEERLAVGCSVQDLNDLVDKGRTFETILADPPWDFETYSELGRDRSPEYNTKGIDRIKALPVKQLAAPNSSLHIWVLMNQLPEALEVIDAWGFTFKTCGFAWMKQNPSGAGLFMGMGYWTRANVEICLLATKGNPRRFDMGVPQALLSPLMEHSRKPDEIHERIERLVQGPYLELYARRERKGWVTWGNEIPRASFINMAAADPATGEIIESPHPETIAEGIPEGAAIVCENALTPAPAEALPELNPTTCLDLEVEDIPAFLRRAPDNSVPVVSRVSTQSAGATGGAAFDHGTDLIDVDQHRRVPVLHFHKVSHGLVPPYAGSLP